MTGLLVMSEDNGTKCFLAALYSRMVLVVSQRQTTVGLCQLIGLGTSKFNKVAITAARMTTNKTNDTVTI